MGTTPQKETSEANEVQAAKEPEALVFGQAPFQSFRGMKNVLAMAGLDESRWGSPILQGYCLQDTSSTASTQTQTPDKKKSKKRQSTGAAVGALVLSLEVAPEAAEKALPQPFERKQFVSNYKQKR